MNAHEDGARLCFACHRPPCDKGFAHLDPASVKKAAILISECQRGEFTRPAVIVPGYGPSKNCICRRQDCFYHFGQDKTEMENV